MGHFMKNPLSYYIMLAKRWAWMLILGTVLCAGASFGVSEAIPPVYQASATLIVYEKSIIPVPLVPTYAHLVTSPPVLAPVVERHPGLTLDQLRAIITVKPQPNTLIFNGSTIIELDVDNTNPQLATELANEVGQSFTLFANSQLPETVQLLPAQGSTRHSGPNVLVNTMIGALVGLGLSLALMRIFLRKSQPHPRDELDQFPE
jgi:polysaccharide biosynthesis transport protein